MVSNSLYLITLLILQPRDLGMAQQAQAALQGSGKVLDMARPWTGPRAWKLSFGCRWGSAGVWDNT